MVLLLGRLAMHSTQRTGSHRLPSRPSAANFGVTVHQGNWRAESLHGPMYWKSDRNPGPLADGNFGSADLAGQISVQDEDRHASLTTSADTD